MAKATTRKATIDSTLKGVSTMNTNVSLNLNEKIQQDFNNLISGYSGVATSYERKDGTVGYKAVYNLKNPIKQGGSTKTTLTTTDMNIIEANEKILFAMNTDTKFSFVICKELERLSKIPGLETMGYKSIQEYAKAVFDMSPVTTRQYVRISEEFIDDEYRIKSATIPADVTKGHMIEYLTLSEILEDDGSLIDLVEKLFEDNILIDGMSTMSTRKALKDYKKSLEAVETTAEVITSNDEKHVTATDTEAPAPANEIPLEEAKKMFSNEDNNEDNNETHTPTPTAEMTVSEQLNKDFMAFTKMKEMVNSRKYDASGIMQLIDEIEKLYYSLITEAEGTR